MIKQDYDFEKQEDEDLRCPICNYYFSQVTKPYLLPCNHNLCYQCIELITNKNMFDCPLCRKPFGAEGKNNFKVPFNYNHIVSSIIYNKIADLNLAHELHTSNSFKFFNFSKKYYFVR